MRTIGLDYGTKTVGVALSDEQGIIASPHTTIVRERTTKLRQTYAQLEQIISEYNVGLIVLGYPKNMNNTEGERAQSTKAFKEALERRTGLPVILFDERLTTVEADRILEETGVARSARKQHIDKMAAAIILQNYLDRENNDGRKDSI
ncbi:MAG: Holliday junction resolvase RuvX [Clostridium sp.]|nr:Holliday junction resolvase RuvX [Clostridium sp.]